ncbi:MAG TPA: ATP-binding protein [Thermodesulfovibrionales bacterium]|nr:ATP-binding protein [Thermodesulfovibrionales bacterium]
MSSLDPAADTMNEGVSKRELSILNLEDNQDDFELLRLKLAKEGIRCSAVRVETKDAFVSALEKGVFDVILSDYSLPAFDGLSALKIAKEKCPGLPFIFLSGAIGEEFAIETLKIGATDYVLKDNLSRLAPSIERALREAEDRAERRRAEEALKQSHDELEQRVQERTAELTKANELLQAEIAEREAAEEERRKILLQLQSYADELWRHRNRLEELVKERTEELITLNKELELELVERRRAEDALHRREQEFKALAENSPDMVSRFDKEMRFTYVNPALERAIDLPARAFVGRTGKEIGFPENLVSLWNKAFQKILKDRRETIIEYEMEMPSGPGYYEGRIVPEFTKDGSIESMIVVSRDITARKRVEEELRASHEQLRSLYEHLESVREEERTMIARELHDELGQTLTALKMDIFWVGRKCSDHQELAEKTRSMSNLVDATIQTVKRICTQLRPSILDGIGLVAAIEWQAKDFQSRTGISCDITFKPEEIVLDRDRSTAIFRIFQEALTNVMRHAEATKVRASFSQSDGKVVLTIEDNGKGISEEDILKPRSFGLIGMRERARLLGGEVEISGVPSEGTVIRITIPSGQEVPL